MQFEPNEEAAAITRKYGPIALNIDRDLIDVSRWSDIWRTFKGGESHWRVNDVGVTETEWQIVYYYLCPQGKLGWTDELTKWDFIDLDEAVERILDRVQTESLPPSP